MERVNCIVFKINNSLYAIEANDVLGIEKNPQLKVLPGTPDFLQGIMDFRGSLTPLVSVRGYFGLPTPPIGVQNDIIVVQSKNDAGEETALAFLTDGVQVITMLDFDTANDVPFMIRSFSNSVQRMTNYNGSPVVFLDIFQILTADQKAALQKFLGVLNQQKEEEEQKEHAVDQAEGEKTEEN